MHQALRKGGRCAEYLGRADWVGHEVTIDGAGEKIGLNDADATNDGADGQTELYSADGKADAVADQIYYYAGGRIWTVAAKLP